MSSCTVFCAGEFDTLVCPMQADELIIAADGGLQHLNKLGLQPTVILGDFDSLGYVPADARVFPVEKDDTDSMLALRHGLEQGCSRFILYGALDGPRHDHTVANYQALRFLADRGATGYLVGKESIVTVIKNSKLVFPAGSGIFSAFCMGADARGVTLRGFQYGLENATLTGSFPLAVSNHFVGTPATVEVTDGTLLVFYPRSFGIIASAPAEAAAQK